MLEELRVRNLALIREAELELGPGLTVLTGETGAGKTALLGALKLLRGERGDAQLVRSGSDEARVEARFSAGGSERIATRRVSADGRSRCSLDDEMATVGSLARVIGPLVDLYGQHDHQSLLKPAAQLGILDAFAGGKAASAKSVYLAAYKAYRKAKEELEQLLGAQGSAAARREQAAFVLREIAALDPKPGEYEALEEQLPRLQNSGQLAEAVRSSLHALRDEGTGAQEALAGALASLQRLQGIDPKLDALAGTLAELAVGAEELAADLRAYRDSIDFDPATLDGAQERLAALDGLAKRFGPRMQDVFAAREEAASAIAETDGIGERIEHAQREASSAEAALRQAGASLGAARDAAAAKLAKRLGLASADLAMADASFEVSMCELPFADWGPEGGNTVEILYSPAAGQPHRPLARIASGGELSRVMLALKGMAHDDGEAGAGMTLVFDEIDAGIGGSVAIAVAERLVQLARHNQVIVVTHLAQIAAAADDHWVVAKSGGESMMRRVAGDERVSEVARMLAGSTDELAREHAMKLLQGRQ
jgi:DNA repair protein RecN (Recombination protein N)